MNTISVQHSGTGQAGLTLVELMVAVLIVAVLLTVGVPAMTDLIRNNRLLSESYAFRAALNQARSEAMSQRTFVTVCTSANGNSCGGTWSDGFVVFSDANGDTTFNSSTDELLLSREVSPSLDLEVASPGSQTALRFDSRGYATGFAGSLVFCDARGSKSARALILSASGNVSAAVDSSGSGVVNLPGGDVNCGSY